MKKKINTAITRKLDQKFDKRFWKKFDEEFSSEEIDEQINWQQFLRPVAMATILIFLTLNLYSRYDGSGADKNFLTEQEIEQILDTNMEVAEIMNSISLEFDDEFYALND